MVIRELFASLFFPMDIVGSWRLCVTFSSHAAVVDVCRLQQTLIFWVPRRKRCFVSTHWFSWDLCCLLALQALCFAALAGVSPSKTHAGRCNPCAREEFTADRSDLLATTPFRTEHHVWQVCWEPAKLPYTPWSAFLQLSTWLSNREAIISRGLMS